MAILSAFVDTSVLIAGTIDFGPGSRASETIMTAVADGRIDEPSTAWHCCLEFYSVSTRLPREYRLSAGQAFELLHSEILGRFRIHALPEPRRVAFLEAIALDRITGGKVYDAHIGEVARTAGCDVIVTENRRDFVSLLRHDIRVLSAEEFVRTFLPVPS